MVQAAPLEEHLPGLDVDLPGDPLPDHAILRTADRGEIRLRPLVARQERGVLRGYGELVQIAPLPVARFHPGYLTVRAVEDHVLAYAVPCYDLAFPPGEYRLPPVALHLEVRRVPVLAEPHELSQVVDDHRTVLPGALLSGHKDVAGGGAARPLVYLDGGRAEFRTRA